MLGTPETPCTSAPAEDCPRCGSTETHSVSIGLQTVEYRCNACERFFRVFIDDEPRELPDLTGCILLGFEDDD